MEKDQHQQALSAVLDLWDTSKGKKSRKATSLPEGIALEMEKYALGLERYANILLQSPQTRATYNLAAHMWVQIRGIHNAAEGFMPGKGAKISERNKHVAAIFSKLWFETEPTIRQPAHSVLKPFPGMLASVSLQIGKFTCCACLLLTSYQQHP